MSHMFADDFTTRPVSNLLHTEETFASYQAGGYHPVRLGDKFKDGRYEVIHKLGWGGFSTVWLARDTHGPNGTHLCVVTEFLGPTLSSIIADYSGGGGRFEPEQLFRLSKRLLQATDTFHQMSTAHGDISGANIVFTVSKLAELSREKLLDIVGIPNTADVERLDRTALDPGLPTQLVESMQWDSWIDEDEEDIRLVDWGQSFAFGSLPERLAQPSQLRAPETIFTDKFDHRVDFWRVGCTIYSMIFSSYPFMYLGDEDVFVAQMIGFVEDLPTEWEEQWQKMKTSSGRTFDHEDQSTGSRLVQKFVKLAPEPELAPLMAVIQGLMRFRPEDRLSAGDALQIVEDGALSDWSD